MFIVSLNYKVALSEIDRLRPAHVEWLRSAYEAGIFLVSGPKNPRTGGVIVAGCSRDVLEAALAEDPFAKAGAADYDVTEFVPAMAAPELEALSGLGQKFT